jgi:hypothetical protein
MSLIKKADVKIHLSVRRKKIVFPFGPVSQPDATSYSGNGRRDTNPNVTNSDTGSQKGASMNPHAMFLRTECVLPDGLDLIQERFCGTWVSVIDTTAAALDVKVRNEGWHFMWLEGAYSRFGVGRTATSAVDKAMASALARIKDRFNAAELESVSVSKYPGFWVAKIKLYARQIQQQASLSMVDEMTIRQLATP